MWWHPYCNGHIVELYIFYTVFVYFTLEACQNISIWFRRITFTLKFMDTFHYLTYTIRYMRIVCVLLSIVLSVYRLHVANSNIKATARIYINHTLMPMYRHHFFLYIGCIPHGDAVQIIVNIRGHCVGFDLNSVPYHRCAIWIARIRLFYSISAGVYREMFVASHPNLIPNKFEINSKQIHCRWIFPCYGYALLWLSIHTHTRTHTKYIIGSTNK